ncbi:MAG TPA: hypothetical protein VKQ36_06300, partial [Ktedonobacterales bacterium]|nr:hypothetical protein [Ktedonobacterales bacterium]
MSGRVKMKCPRCHKMFRPSNAKQNLCDECTAKERAARSLAKTTPVKSAPQAPATVSKLKISGPGANILVPGMTAPTSDAPPPELGPLGAAARREEETARRRSQSVATPDQRYGPTHAEQG